MPRINQGLSHSHRRAAAPLLSALLWSAGCAEPAARDASGDGERPDRTTAQAGLGSSAPGTVNAALQANEGGVAPTDLEVQPLMFTTSDLPVELLEEGGPIELWAATQGGHVLLVGARVRGLESDTIDLAVQVRDPDTGFILAREQRVVLMEPVADEPGWMQTDRRTRSQVAHVPVCPNYDARDVVDMPWLVEVEVTELYTEDFSSGRAEVVVAPTCAQAHPAERLRCHCECLSDYALGKCNASTVDAGAPAAPEAGVDG